jgi:hypothetical protein
MVANLEKSLDICSILYGCKKCPVADTCRGGYDRLIDILFDSYKFQNNKTKTVNEQLEFSGIKRY